MIIIIIVVFGEGQSLYQFYCQFFGTLQFLVYVMIPSSHTRISYNYLNRTGTQCQLLSLRDKKGDFFSVL